MTSSSWRLPRLGRLLRGVEGPQAAAGSRIGSPPRIRRPSQPACCSWSDSANHDLAGPWPAPGEQLGEVRVEHAELVAPGVAHDPEVKAALLLMVMTIGRGGRELGEWLVGLPGLEPGTSSLSGFCTRACFCRIAPATRANDEPLETATNRWVPMGCGPNVDQAWCANLWPPLWWDRWRRSSSSKSPSTAQNLSASLVSGARCCGTSYRRHRRGLLLGTISIARCRLSIRVQGSHALIPQVWARDCSSSAFPKAKSSRIGCILTCGSAPGSWVKSAWPHLRPNAHDWSRSARYACDYCLPMATTSRAS